MLGIVICDDLEADRAAARQGVENYLTAHPELSGHTDVFASPSELLDALEGGAAWDIALLDVYMPGMLGTQVTRELSRRLEDLTVIFLTTSADYAVEAFDLGAVHYLLKPFTQEKLNTALDRAIASCHRGEGKSLLLHMESGVTCAVPLDKITHIESMGHRQMVHTARGTFDERQYSLAALYDRLQALSPGQFITPCRGYIVNQDAVRTISTHGIELHSGASVPMKKGSFRKVRDAYFQWIFEKGEGA